MNTPNQIIYQYCLHNYDNHYEMLNRIHHLIRGYKDDLMDLERYTYHLEFFKNNHQVILVDLVPPFMQPDVKQFDFNDYEEEKWMIMDIGNVTNDFILTNCDPEKTLLIQVIHSIGS